jgi:hypothetical protein
MIGQGLVVNPYSVCLTKKPRKWVDVQETTDIEL